VRRLTTLAALASVLWICSAAPAPASRQEPERPNVLLLIADDWSHPDAGVLGNRGVRTPAFDRIAREGTLFRWAFTAAPSCTASRGAILTGRWPHELKSGGNLWSALPTEFETYPDLLEQAGYAVGLQGKGWGPGSLEAAGRTRNPAGPSYESFQTFLAQVPSGQPFAFWIGPSDPHRPYEAGLAARTGLTREHAQVPPTLPDVPAVRDDLLDYYAEVERFDRTVADALALLESKGLLDRTLIIVTGDNGRPFPRDKANLYDGGTQVPLAVRWPGRARAGAVVEGFVSLIDLAPTALEAAGVSRPAGMTGRSLVGVLEGGETDQRDRVFVERERHAHVRAGNLSYPMRGVRTKDYFYIRNFAPDRWPAGDPVMVSSVGPFGDVDDGPSKWFVLAYRDDPAIRPYYERAFAKRPAEELYALAADPHQLGNVAGEAAHAAAQRKHRDMLDAWMRDTGDPRATSDADPWSEYEYFGSATPWPEPPAP
jgi:N-sulfoglucosamine sulfohydrolase